jgi:hypothetical protein
MKLLIPLLIALGLPAMLFAQTQPGSENRYRDRPGMDNRQDSPFMDRQYNPMDKERRDRGHGRGILQNSRDGSRVQRRQSMGDDSSRGHFRHDTEARHLRDRHQGDSRRDRRHLRAMVKNHQSV